MRHVFGEDADRIVIANTKGFTGHAMATGIEEVVAVKALETGCVPPVANFKEIDPELGSLNLSKGGSYPVEYALRLAAGFGSQICLALLRWVKTKDGVRPRPNTLGYTLSHRRSRRRGRLGWSGPPAMPPRSWKWSSARCGCEIKKAAARLPSCQRRAVSAGALRHEAPASAPAAAKAAAAASCDRELRTKPDGESCCRAACSSDAAASCRGGRCGAGTYPRAGGGEDRLSQ